MRVCAEWGWVYPRVCGGSHHHIAAATRSIGLSPRVRGKRAGRTNPDKPAGSIPACAGEARWNTWAIAVGTVYPRVCGGSAAAAAMASLPMGLSPRVRGKPRRLVGGRPCRRSIPACAGEAVSPGRSTSVPAVYPRVCGGSIPNGAEATMVQGLSPRVRGKPVRTGAGAATGRSIPACAGEAGRGWPSGWRCWVYPRVCGGSPGLGLADVGLGGLSPRVRGKPPGAPPCRC